MRLNLSPPGLSGSGFSPNRRTAWAADRLAGLFLVLLFALSALPLGANATTLEEKVIRAALADYVHGVTEEIANQEIGVEGVPVLLELLADPASPRRDNVMAFLAHLGGPEATRALLSFLEDPPAPVSAPEEDRALLLAPQALGGISSRGDSRALEALLAMTGHGSRGGVLSAAAARSGDPQRLRDDLLEMALRGLAYSRHPEARRRIAAVAEGRIVPAPNARSLARPAAGALALFDSLGSPETRSLPGSSGAIADGTSAEGFSSDLSSATESTQVLRDTVIDYANHPDHPNPMTDGVADQLLAEGSRRVGAGNFSGDVACCASCSRLEPGAVYGIPGDGLDIIDDSPELVAVLNDTSARMKVVRLINYCGYTGYNVLGCASGSYGAAVVRLSSVGREAVLWFHEYGHLAGLPHNSDTRYVMHGVNYETSNGVNQAECDAYRYPIWTSGAYVRDAGACGAALPGCGNSVCETGENCVVCPGDCPIGGPSCGNGICEARDGEDCLSCSQDCRGKQHGKSSSDYFCCGDGAGVNPLPCSDPLCSSSGSSCTDIPAPASCCGDLLCEGREDGLTCSIDCGAPPAPPACGDWVCNGNETACTCAGDCGAAPASESTCTDLIDNDCDGVIDCNDSDCNPGPACLCQALGAACSTGGDCCSGKCRGRAGARSCR